MLKTQTIPHYHCDLCGAEVAKADLKNFRLSIGERRNMKDFCTGCYDRVASMPLSEVVALKPESKA